MLRVEIVEFEPRFAVAFKALNLAWIRRDYELEAKDHEILGDPQGQVVAKGGQVLIALANGEPAGCCALLAMADGGFEIAKMAVGEAFRGRGLAKALMAACIARARAAGAPRLYLESNLKQVAALGLYRAFGFEDLPPERRPVSPYARADVWMELRL
ncbi:MAG: GNAT family N-acetyltransferase [Caulobacteraceae bacterium]